MNIKKVIAFLLACMLLFSFTACDQADDDRDEGKKDNSNVLQEKPEELEVVLTGRDPAPELMELADYMSEICMRKHPFEQGIPARKGIEF